MLELSIPARFALMFVLLMIANKEYRKLDTINDMSWGDITMAVITMAVTTFIAGGLLKVNLLEILYMPMG